MKFSEFHEWVEAKDDIATVGVSNFGKMHLGDVVNISLPNIGKKVTKNEEVLVLESNKAAVDVHSPISGEIIEVNEKLKNDLKLLNTSPENEGWLFKVKMTNSKEIESLMTLEEYEKKVSK